MSRRRWNKTEKATTAKIERDTLRMLRATQGDYITVDQAIWKLATRCREFFELRAEVKKTPESELSALRTRYGIPADREVYRRDPVGIPPIADVERYTKAAARSAGIPKSPRGRARKRS